MEKKMENGWLAKNFVLGIFLASFLLSGLVLAEDELPPGMPPLESGYRVDFAAGWNLFSVPVAGFPHPLGAITGVEGVPVPPLPFEKVFPGGARIVESTCRESAVWHYEPLRGEYVSRGRLVEGNILPSREGFWNNQPSDCYIILEGDRRVSLDGLPLSPEWNQIGAPSQSVEFSEVRGNCVVENGPYWYNPGESRYVKSGTFEPGKGYFVKVARACVLGGDKPPKPPLPPVPWPPEPACKRLPNEFTFDPHNVVGESTTAPNGFSVRLMDISATTYGNDYQRVASFNLFDANGNLVDSFLLQKCDTHYDASGVSVRLLDVRGTENASRLAAVTSYGYANVTQNQTPYCVDSDGGLGGASNKIRGHAYGFAPSLGNFDYYDQCFTEGGESYVREYFCSGYLPGESGVKCPNGCSNGACITRNDNNSSTTPFVKSFYDLVITPEHPSCPETIRVFDPAERWRFIGFQQGQNLIHLETEDMLPEIADRDFNDVVFTTAVANNGAGAQTLTVALEGCDTAAKDGIRVDLGFSTPKIMKLQETGEVQSGLNGSFQLWSDCHGHVGESKTIKITDERTPPLEIIHINDLADDISTYSPGCTATMPSPFNAITYFYRQVRNCADNSVLHNQLIYTDGNYCNFVCRNRYKEQCIEDGSFDTYYDEECPEIR